MCQFFLFLLRLHIALNANRDSDSPETEYVRKTTINKAVVATMSGSVPLRQSQIQLIQSASGQK